MENTNKIIFLDGTMATYVNREVMQEMMPTFNSVFANPVSNHAFGRIANQYVDIARKRVAKGINAESNEIYFTSGNVESNYWAILGLARANKDKGNHIITSKIEDKSILLACKQLEKEGFKVSYVGCDDNGIVSLSQIMGAMRHDTILVSVQVANGEVGTIQNLNAIARTVKEKNILFHCDATFALGQMPLDVKAIPIDAMTISSDVIYGPKGVGALFVKEGTNIENFMAGDNSENGKRAGNVNVPAIVGFGKAVELATTDVFQNSHKLKIVRDYFVRSLMENIENVTLNGSQHQRVSNIANLTFDCVDNEALAVMLDLHNVCVTPVDTRFEPSYVLKEMRKTPEQSHSSLRFAFVKNINKVDVDNMVETFVVLIKKLRELSPLRKSTKENK